MTNFSFAFALPPEAVDHAIALADAVRKLAFARDEAERAAIRARLPDDVGGPAIRLVEEGAAAGGTGCRWIKPIEGNAHPTREGSRAVGQLCVVSDGDAYPYAVAAILQETIKKYELDIPKISRFSIEDALRRGSRRGR